MRVFAVAIALAACSGPRDAFDCTESTSCRMGGVLGTCETTGFCSFPDPTCPLGSRYGTAAGGGLGGECVGGGGGSDAGFGSDAGMNNGVPDPLDTWVNGTAIPIGRYTHASATDGSLFYVIGGVFGATGHADVWFTNVNTGAVLPTAAVTAWTQTTSLPANRWTFAATYNAGYIYTFGGRTDANADTTDVLSAPVNGDGTLGPWALSATPMPASIKCMAVASSGSNVYVIGGRSGLNPVAYVLSGQMAGGDVTSWKLAATFDTTVFNEAAVVANGYLYVIGGCAIGKGQCTSLVDTVEVAKINADGTLGAFTHTTPLPQARWHHTAAMSVSNNTLYVLGGKYLGQISDPSTPDVIGAYVGTDGSLSAWQSMSPLVTPHVRYTSAVIGNFLVFIGNETEVAHLH